MTTVADGAMCGDLVNKTSHSEKSIAKHKVKHTFCNIAKTRAVMRRELLREMVSQGRPHPQGIASRC